MSAVITDRVKVEGTEGASLDIERHYRTPDNAYLRLRTGGHGVVSHGVFDPQVLFAAIEKAFGVTIIEGVLPEIDASTNEQYAPGVNSVRINGNRRYSDTSASAMKPLLEREAVRRFYVANPVKPAKSAEEIAAEIATEKEIEKEIQKLEGLLLATSALGGIFTTGIVKAAKSLHDRGVRA